MLSCLEFRVSLDCFASYQWQTKETSLSSHFFRKRKRHIDWFSLERSKGELQPATCNSDEYPMERLHSVSPDKRMLLRLQHKNGLLADENRQYGLLMHDILSRIVKQEDITNVLYAKYCAGEINREEAALLKEQLLLLTSDSEVFNWFNGSMQVLNETEILFKKGQSLRPDRIMIDANHQVFIVDYKFGEQKRQAYQHQLEEYAALMHEMGYQTITGYLWYVTINEIERYFFWKYFF